MRMNIFLERLNNWKRVVRIEYTNGSLCFYAIYNFNMARAKNPFHSNR